MLIRPIGRWSDRARSDMADDKIDVFISYAHEDGQFCEGLKKHLAGMDDIVRNWTDREIPAGDEWDEAIKTQLDGADIILLLVSSDFLNSSYCRQHEIPRAMERHDERSARVVPVILRSCDWTRQPFAKLQAYPTDAEPVNLWRDMDLAFTSVMAGLRSVAESLLEQRVQEREQAGAVEEQYRRKVEELLADGEISMLERDTLDELRERLKIPTARAEDIEAEARKPHEEKLQSLRNYEKSLRKVIAHEGAEISEPTQNELKLRRRDLGLTDEDVADATQRILAEAANERAQQEAREREEREAAEREERAAAERAEREEADRQAAAEADRRAQEDAERRAREEAEQTESAEALEFVRVQTLHAFLSLWDADPVEILVAPEIPEKKLVNGVQRFGVPEEEVVLALIDTTVFGSAKDGLIFGAHGVYFRNIGGEIHNVSYEDFPACSFAVEGADIQMTDGVAFNALTPDDVAVYFMVLRDFLAFRDRSLSERGEPVTAENVEDAVRSVMEGFSEHVSERASEAMAEAQATAAAMPSAEEIFFLLAPFAGGSIYVHPDIPDKKERNVRAVCEIDPETELVAIIDLTVLGSAKDCWAFTGDALVCRPSGNEIYTIPYLQFPTLSFTPTDAIVPSVEVTLDDGSELELSLAGSDCASETAAQMLDAIRLIVTEALG